jgi:hypothetical protein
LLYSNLEMSGIGPYTQGWLPSQHYRICALDKSGEGSREVYLKLRLFLTLLISALFLPVTGSAALVVNSFVSTPTMVTLLATWTDPDLPGSNIINQGLPNWDIDLISLSIGGGVGLEITASEHKVAPHPGEAGTGVALQLSFFSVSPGVGGGTKTISANHPGGNHYDKLVATLTPTKAGLESSLSVVASHNTPEPGSLGLGLLGSALLLAIHRRSVRQSR